MYIYIYTCINLCTHSISLSLCTLQHTATHCNTLQHTAAHRNTLQHTASHCNTLQHTATHCHTAMHLSILDVCTVVLLQRTATHCSTLQHTATHGNTLQHKHTFSTVAASTSHSSNLSETVTNEKPNRPARLTSR